MKILIVEDETSIAENISYALSAEGYEPLWCETGRDALIEFCKSNGNYHLAHGNLDA